MNVTPPPQHGASGENSSYGSTQNDEHTKNTSPLKSSSLSTTPNPLSFPIYRKPSQRAAPGFTTPEHKTRAAQAFRTGATDYDAVRPRYPEFVATFAGDKPSDLAGTVLDIGAGTGKLTLALPHQQVLACDPSADMVRLLHQAGIPSWLGVAEALPLADSTLNTAFCAQAWHWIDAQLACKELDRVLVPGGCIVLVWNTLNVNDYPWVLRLARIMHSGDIQRPNFVPEIHPPWHISATRREKWTQQIQVAHLHTLMHSRSYWLNAKPHIRARLTHNLTWYLNEHLGLADESFVDLPYRTDAFLLTRLHES